MNMFIKSLPKVKVNGIQCASSYTDGINDYFLIIKHSWKNVNFKIFDSLGLDKILRKGIEDSLGTQTIMYSICGYSISKQFYLYNNSDIIQIPKKDYTHLKLRSDSKGFDYLGNLNHAELVCEKIYESTPSFELPLLMNRYRDFYNDIYVKNKIPDYFYQIEEEEDA